MNELMDYRLNHSLITNKKESVHSVLSHVIGIQAQYPNYAKINIINRLHENAYTHFYHSLDHPETVMAWGQRRTVHYYSKEDWLRLAVFFEQEVKWPDKHLHNMGYSIDDEIKRMESLFSNRNPVEKKDLQEYYQEEWKDLFHWSALFLKASSEGNLYFKLKENKKYYYWNHFDEIQVDRRELELKMLRQYFSAYGPATKADAAHFLGVRQSFFTIPFEEYFNVYQIEGINYYYSDLLCSNQNPEVILLGKFDPLLLAYKDKRWIVSKDEEPQIWRKAAQVEAVVIINNKFAGTWRYKVRGGRVVFNVFLREPVNKYLKEKIEEALQPFAFALNKEFHAVEFL